MADYGSVSGVAGVPGDPSRQGGLPSRRRPPSTAPRRGLVEPEEYDSGGYPLQSQDPTAPLVEALDRLRATDELRPADAQMVRLLRGAKYYQEESRSWQRARTKPDAVDAAGVNSSTTDDAAVPPALLDDPPPSE